MLLLQEKDRDLINKELESENPNIALVQFAASLPSFYNKLYVIRNTGGIPVGITIADSFNNQLSLPDLKAFLGCHKILKKINPDMKLYDTRSYITNHIADSFSQVVNSSIDNFLSSELHTTQAKFSDDYLNKMFECYFLHILPRVRSGYKSTHFENNAEMNETTYSGLSLFFDNSLHEVIYEYPEMCANFYLKDLSNKKFSEIYLNETTRSYSLFRDKENQLSEHFNGTIFSLYMKTMCDIDFSKIIPNLSCEGKYHEEVIGINKQIVSICLSYAKNNNVALSFLLDKRYLINLSDSYNYLFGTVISHSPTDFYSSYIDGQFDDLHYSIRSNIVKNIVKSKKLTDIQIRCLSKKVLKDGSFTVKESFYTNISTSSYDQDFVFDIFNDVIRNSKLSYKLALHIARNGTKKNLAFMIGSIDSLDTTSSEKKEINKIMEKRFNEI